MQRGWAGTEGCGQVQRGVDRCRGVWTGTEGCGQVQRGVDRCRERQTGVEGCREAQRDADRHRGGSQVKRTSNIHHCKALFTSGCP